MTKLSVVISVIVILISFCVHAKKKNIVFAKKIKTVELFDKFSYPARVISEVHSTILSESQGIIAKLNVKLGASVKRGKLVAKVRHTDPAFQYRAVNLKALVSGVVSDVMVTEGTLVAKGTKLLTITDPMRLKVLIEIPASDLKYIKANAIGRLKLRYLKKSVLVVVSGVSPVLDPATGTATAVLHIKNKSDILNIKIGTIGQAEFKSNLHQGFSVPEHSIVYEGRIPHLRTVVDKKLKRIPVSLGKKRAGKVEVVDGLKNGAVVINRVNGYIAEGSEVVVQ